MDKEKKYNLTYGLGCRLDHFIWVAKNINSGYAEHIPHELLEGIAKTVNKTLEKNITKGHEPLAFTLVPKDSDNLTLFRNIEQRTNPDYHPEAQGVTLESEAERLIKKYAREPAELRKKFAGEFSDRKQEDWVYHQKQLMKFFLQNLDLL